MGTTREKARAQRVANGNCHPSERRFAVWLIDNRHAHLVLRLDSDLWIPRYGLDERSAEWERGSNNACEVPFAMGSGMKRSESQLSLIDGEMKNASVKELAKAGITIEGLRDDMAPEEREKIIRTYRRKLANRESAKRSKIRKKAEDAKLLDTTKTLLADAKSMRQTIQDLQRKVDVLHAENVKLRRRLGENVGADGELMSSEIAHVPVNVPPEVETPSAVIKDTRKKLKRSMPSESDLPKKMAPKRRGMLKSNSDSSIATNFGDNPQYAIAGAPATAEVVEPYARAFKNGAVGGGAPQEDAYGDFCVDKFLNLLGSNNRADSPFFTDNLMYGCQDGELVNNAEDSWAL